MLSYLRRLARFEDPTRLDWIVYFVLFTLLHIPAVINFYHNNGENNAYLQFAQSLLQGHLSLPAGLPEYQDMIMYHNQPYLPYPPLPSLLLVPLVAVFGVHHVNTVFVVVVLSCLNLYLLHRLFKKLGVEARWFPWLVAGFFFGTGYWYALFTSHHVYAFAQITSCCFQLLLLNELFGRKRWWLAGVYIGLSFLARQFTVFYIVFALGCLWQEWKEAFKGVGFGQLVQLGVGCGLFVGIYFLYNALRFGNPFDPGYAYILYNGVLKERVQQYGVFSTRYFLFNIYSFFIKGFNINFGGPGMMRIQDMDRWGTSLLSASPFLVASVRAKWPKGLRVAAWFTVVLILFGQLFYHNNGFEQVNTMRFSLDFLPLLFVLTALGLKDIPSWLIKGMISYAILLNLISFLIHFLYQ
jgi:hypothetical protein